MNKIMNIEIVKYSAEDCAATRALFYETVHSVNARDYSPEQLSAWAPREFDGKKWNNSFLEHISYVAKSGDKTVGFGDISEDGYLDRLYVHKDFQGLGIASTLCDKLESSVKAKEIETHASLTAKGFFERRGYVFIRRQIVERAGVCMPNCVMIKSVNK